MLVLGSSLDLNHPSGSDRVALHTLHLSAMARAALDMAGWRLREVPILEPSVGAKQQKYARSFTKLHLWNLTEYEQVIYLDSDIIALSSLDDLWCPTELCAAPDMPLGDHFNGGLLSLRPNSGRYRALIATLNSWNSDAFPLPYAAQDFLNVYFNSTSGLFKMLPSTANMPSSVYYVPATEYHSLGRISVLHFTAFKPWDWTSYPLCDELAGLWLQSEQSMLLGNPPLGQFVTSMHGRLLLIYAILFLLLLPCLTILAHRYHLTLSPSPNPFWLRCSLPAVAAVASIWLAIPSDIPFWIGWLLTCGVALSVSAAMVGLPQCLLTLAWSDISSFAMLLSSPFLLLVCYLFFVPHASGPWLTNRLLGLATILVSYALIIFSKHHVASSGAAKRGNLYSTSVSEY